jgi:hypothetical protein
MTRERSAYLEVVIRQSGDLNHKSASREFDREAVAAKGGQQVCHPRGGVADLVRESPEVDFEHSSASLRAVLKTSRQQRILTAMSETQNANAGRQICRPIRTLLTGQRKDTFAAWASGASWKRISAREKEEPCRRTNPIASSICSRVPIVSFFISSSISERPSSITENCPHWRNVSTRQEIPEIKQIQIQYLKQHFSVRFEDEAKEGFDLRQVEGLGVREGAQEEVVRDVQKEVAVGRLRRHMSGESTLPDGDWQITFPSRPARPISCT